MTDLTLCVEQAFISHWKTVVSPLIGMDTAYENDGYDPTAGTPYAAIKMFPNETIPADLDSTASTTGFFQFELRYALGGGAMLAKQMRQTIFDAFPDFGGLISYGGANVSIQTKYPVFAEREDGWFVVTGRISYTATLGRG